MSEIVKKKKLTTIKDRVPVDKNCIEIIDSHIKAVKDHKPGVYLTRKDYLEYLILNLSQLPTANELKKLADRFFDEERFLRYLMNKSRLAKKNGEDFDFSEYLPSLKQKKRIGNGTKKTLQNQKPIRTHTLNSNDSKPK